VLDALGMEPRDLIRRREKEYKELGLADTSLTRDELISAMAEHPRLIERPVGLTNGRAALGRPAERLLDLI
jgi:arsenate reductase